MIHVSIHVSRDTTLKGVGLGSRDCNLRHRMLPSPAIEDSSSNQFVACAQERVNYPGA